MVDDSCQCDVDDPRRAGVRGVHVDRRVVLHGAGVIGLLDEILHHAD